MYQPKQRLIVPVAFDLSASPSALLTWTMGDQRAILVLDLKAIYTEVSGPATTAGVLSLGYDALTAGSEVEKAKITDAGQAVGAEVGVDTAFTPFEVSESDTLYFRLKTQAATGTTTGAGYFVLEYVDVPRTAS
jgi:hypothetical protein